MHLIIDSGSTKADWIMTDLQGKQVLFHTVGFNPVFHTVDYIVQEVNKALPEVVLREEVSQVFFYGAGCWDPPRQSVIHKALKRLFPKAATMVEHDLLGAARAACGTEPGIACILGTGSNSCSYDGEQILDNVTNLGYLLGDEGSGTHIGKLLIKAYFYRDLPTDLIPAFEQFISGGKTEILNKVYGPETPNRYLAKFARFANMHKDHPFIRKILSRALGEFLDCHVVKYAQFPEYPLHFVGSIAFHFKEVLFELCRERGATPGRIIQKPIEHLLHYHVQTAQL